MKMYISVAVLLSQITSAQEPYDLNQYGKGIVDAKTAKETDNERHFSMKFTFIIKDEAGNPVSDADVNVGIASSLHMDGHNNFKGKTDETGKFTVEARGCGSSEIVVAKDGYYPSSPDVEWSDKRNLDINNLRTIGFQPWNQTLEVILKKREKPIPMIVRWGLGSTDHIRYAPKLDEEVGYDLVAGDWVKPHGSGAVSDIQVMFKSDFKSPEDYSTSAKFRFSNPDDGLIPIASLIGSESLLKYPRSAPENGYEVKSIELTKHSGEQPQPMQEEPIGYFLRLRTIVEPSTGKILSAKYGKIIKEPGHNSNESPFRLSSGMWKERKFDPTPGFQISYYLNPTPNDRNLEYDQQNNLAPEADKGATYPP